MPNAPKRIKTEDEDGYTSDSQRPSGSCETCKTRKVKCDRTRPSCNWCRRNNAECVYKTKKKPGLKPGFGKELTSRIATVEEELARHATMLETISQRLGTNTSSQLNQNDSSPSQQHNILLHNHHHSHPSHPSHQNHQNQQNHYHHVQQYPQNHASSSQTPESLSSSVQQSNIPDTVLVRELINLYFTRLYPQFPILHPENTKKWLHSVVNSGLQEPWPMLLYSIVTVSLKLLPSTRLTSELKNTYYEHCKDKVILQSLNITTIDRLQALVILAVEMVGISNGPQTWGILALISSGAIHLRICREAASNTGPNNNESISTKADEVLPAAENTIELESRRRLFWGIYMLDRYSAVATSFAFRISETEIDRMLPVTDELWTSDNTSDLPKTRWLQTPNRTDYTLNNVKFIDPFGYLVELLRILGSMHDFLREPVNIGSLTDVIQWQMRYRRLDQEIEDWFKALPAEFTEYQAFSTRNWSPIKILIYSTYLTAIIRLHSSAGYAFLKSEFFTTSPSAGQKCVQAAKNMTALARQVSAVDGWEQMGPHYAWCIWVSARLMLVDCVTAHKNIPSELEFLIQHLRSLGKFWKVAARYWEILNLVIDEELSLRTSKPNSTEISEDSGKKGSNTQIFSDMRRNAYALDFLLSNNNNNGGNRGDQDESPAMPNSPPPPENAEPENLNGMFDWFNWPKAMDGIDTPQLQQHSLDEYKNILSRDGPFEDYISDSQQQNQSQQQQDWLQRAS